MKNKLIGWAEGIKGWLVAFALILSFLGIAGNVIYANIMAPKVKNQIQEEIFPYITQIEKLTRKVDYLVYINEQSIDKEKLADLRRGYYMRKNDE